MHACIWTNICSCMYIYIYIYKSLCICTYEYTCVYSLINRLNHKHHNSLYLNLSFVHNTFEISKSIATRNSRVTNEATGTSVKHKTYFHSRYRREYTKIPLLNMETWDTFIVIPIPDIGGNIPKFPLRISNEISLN